MTKDGIDLIWNPILKYPKDKDTGEPDMSREPTLKVKLLHGKVNLNLNCMTSIMKC